MAQTKRDMLIDPLVDNNPDHASGSRDLFGAWR